MAGKEPSEEDHSSGDIFTLISVNPIGQPKPYKHGDDFYQFCDRFTEFVCLHNITTKLDLLLLSFVDDRTHATLKTVPLENEDKLCPVKLCAAYKRGIDPGLANGHLIAKLFTMKQELNESVDNFAYRINKIAQKMRADEGTVNSHKLEAFILGVHNVHIKIELIKCEKISFGQAITRAREFEQIIQGNKEPSSPINHHHHDEIDHKVRSSDSNDEWTTVNRSRPKHRPVKYESRHRHKVRPRNNDRSFSSERSYLTREKDTSRKCAKIKRKSRDDDHWCPFRRKGKRNNSFQSSSSSSSEHFKHVSSRDRSYHKDHSHTTRPIHQATQKSHSKTNTVVPLYNAVFRIKNFAY